MWNMTTRDISDMAPLGKTLTVKELQDDEVNDTISGLKELGFEEDMFLSEPEYRTFSRYNYTEDTFTEVIIAKEIEL